MPDHSHEMEIKFFNALRDIFVGAPVEGQSGYINLMRIKSQYYTAGVFPRLKADIDTVCAPFDPAFREDLFNKLYNFFYRYFSESGSIYFRYTPLRENVYERVYSDNQDVMLFWKTHMLYYVKTDRLFQCLDVDADGAKVYFDVSTVQHKKANEKREVVYEFGSVREDGAIVLTVSYAEKGRKTKADDILKAAKRAGAALTDEQLERACRVFEKQVEVDYFINKDAGRFLREQFDIWLYQYVFEPGQQTATHWTETRLRQLQAIKTIAYKIIDFIAQFEDELVKIWNKPKFALNAHYIITLDHIADRDAALLARLFEHPGLAAQVAEWQQLGMVGQGFTLTPGPSPSQGEGSTPSPLKGEGRGEGQGRYRYLPLDTRHFPDLEPDILALFDHLDDALDGWLIKSENYQALNTLSSRFRDQISAIYIDPPYNTGTEASDFIYTNQFRNSSWITMIENRLGSALHLLKTEGVLCVTIDDYEFSHLSMLLDELNAFSLGVAVIKSKPQGRATARGFSVNHEYAIFASKTEKADVGRLPRIGQKADRYPERDEIGIYAWTNFRGTGANSTRKDRPKLFYPVYVAGDKVRVADMVWNKDEGVWQPQQPSTPDEELIFPVDSDGEERVWTLGWERAQKNLHELKVVRGSNGTQIHRKYRPNYEGALPGTWWDNKLYSASESGTKVLQNILGSQEEFSYPKSIHAVVDCLRSCGLGVVQSGVALDFFAGSGTTGHAVINLNREDGGHRKYILIEMGSHFDTVILPRIKKVVFSDQWKDGQAVEGGQGVSHFCKYYQLEQYEDTLRRALYQDAPLFVHGDPYSNYVFLRDLKMLDAVTLDTAANTAAVHLDNLYEGIDLAETLANVLGQRIARLTREAVTFEDGTTIDLTKPDLRHLKPLIWW
jgi:adenine-specific DNA-methyltransferase